MCSFRKAIDKSRLMSLENNLGPEGKINGADASCASVAHLQEPMSDRFWAGFAFGGNCLKGLDSLQPSPFLLQKQRSALDTSDYSL